MAFSFCSAWSVWGNMYWLMVWENVLMYTVLAHYGFFLWVEWPMSKFTVIYPWNIKGIMNASRSLIWEQVEVSSRQSLLFWGTASFSREWYAVIVNMGHFKFVFFCILGAWTQDFVLSMYSVTLPTHPAIFALLCFPGWVLHFCPWWTWTIILLHPSSKYLGSHR
jgi:hypothetical protein